MSTAKGYTCQRWDSQTPHRHSFGDRRPSVLPANYCRNPDHNLNGAWCYLDTNEHRWAYCDIPPCKRNKVIFFDGEHWSITYGEYKDNLDCGSGAVYSADKIEKNLSMAKFYLHRKLDLLDDTCDVEEESPHPLDHLKPQPPGQAIPPSGSVKLPAGFVKPVEPPKPGPPAPIKTSRVQHQHLMDTIPGFKELYNKHINNEILNNPHFSKQGNSNQHVKAPPTPAPHPRPHWGRFQPPQQQRQAHWPGHHRRHPPHLRRPPVPHLRRPFM